MSEIIVAPNGMLRFIYDDDLASMLQDIGTLSVSRASHVEPTEEGQWTADMSPCGGPVLGPYFTRSGALDAEKQWIEQNGIPIPKAPKPEPKRGVNYRHDDEYVPRQARNRR